MLQYIYASLRGGSGSLGVEAGGWVVRSVWKPKWKLRRRPTSLVGIGKHTHCDSEGQNFSHNNVETKQVLQPGKIWSLVVVVIVLLHVSSKVMISSLRAREERPW